MASKWNKQPCPVCAVGTLADGTRQSVQTYKGHTFQASSRGAFCNHCGDGFVSFDPQDEAAWLAFRSSVDAACATELASIRKKLKLTQQQAAQIAGGGKNAFSRYERGLAKPVAAVINLFRLLERRPELLQEVK